MQPCLFVDTPVETNRGFTLIEVLIAAGVMACGLVAAACLFSYAIRANAFNRQTAVATTLVYEKMEEFRSHPTTAPIWINAAGSETVVVAGEAFVRSWKISGSTSRTVTVTVSTGSRPLIRATTIVSPVF
jgi:prepilin-type N-terminal cleavage/methylation domain-containing protein